MLFPQQPVPGPPPAPSAPPPAAQSGARTDQPAQASTPRVFASDAGVIFNAVRSDRVAAFETILGRLRQALAQSADPQRREQAVGWKVFKAAEPGPNNSVLFLFVMDPAVKGADYSVARILAEAFPDEAQDLYRQYTGAFASSQTLLNLNPLAEPPAAAPGAPATPTGPAIQSAPTPSSPVR